jgi:acyl-CoA reductase-like NAD-dependent aldehyde dehydrogenase
VIVVDTSALMGIVLGALLAGACGVVLKNSEETSIPAGTLAKALVVAGWHARWSR